MPKHTLRSSRENRRASPDAVAKRRAAREFNEILLGPSPKANDGRTERRRRRLMEELSAGATRTGRDLKPIEVLLRAQELLDLGETPASIAQVRPPPAPLPVTDELVEGVRKLHDAYQFASEVYRFVGIDEKTLTRAGALSEQSKPRGPVKARVRPPAGAARRGVA